MVRMLFVCLAATLGTIAWAQSDVRTLPAPPALPTPPESQVPPGLPADVAVPEVRKTAASSDTAEEEPSINESPSTTSTTKTPTTNASQNADATPAKPRPLDLLAESHGYGGPGKNGEPGKVDSGASEPGASEPGVSKANEVVEFKATAAPAPGRRDTDGTGGAEVNSKPATATESTVQEAITGPGSGTLPEAIAAPIESAPILEGSDLIRHSHGHAKKEPANTWHEDEIIDLEVEECSKGRGRVWGRFDYLYWFTKETSTPPLLTTGFTTATRPGALDQAGTKVLFGDTIDFGDYPGGRFVIGVGLDEESTRAVEFGYLFLGTRHQGTTRTSPGSPVLARPFVDVVNNVQDASLIAFPGLVLGSVDIFASHELDGYEGNYIGNVWHCETSRIDWLAGFRYLYMGENLRIVENATVVKTGVPFAGNNIVVRDQFDTRNVFLGGQIGLQAEVRRKRFVLSARTKIALGNVHETFNIQGSTHINTSPATVSNAGLLALASNSGQYAEDGFAVVPEVNVNLGIHLTQRVQVTVGYTFLYWSRVARPGDQIDLRVNPNQVPTSASFGTAGGPSLPAFPARETAFWAQGVNVGLAIRY